jgi:hypothetical protein
VRSVFCDRAEPVGAQQVAAARPADPAGLYRPDNLACGQVPCEDRREQAGVGGEVADRVVLSDLAEPDRAEVAHGAITARSLENRIEGSTAPKPVGRVT